MNRTDKWISRLEKVEAAYIRAARYAFPQPKRYVAMSVALTVVNVATGVKYGVATKVASLLF